MVNGLLTEREILDKADSWGFIGIEKYLKSKTLELITRGDRQGKLFIKLTIYIKQDY